MMFFMCVFKDLGGSYHHRSTYNVQYWLGRGDTDGYFTAGKRGVFLHRFEA